MIKTMLAHYPDFRKTQPAIQRLRRARNLVHDRQPLHSGHRRGLRKGVRGFDANAALDAMIDSMNQDRNDPRSIASAVSSRTTRTRESKGVSKTLEYADNDACVSRFAAMIGRADAAAANRACAATTGECLGSQDRFHAGKDRRGQVRRALRPAEVTFFDYTEANAWQYAFFVPHDVPGLIEALGGDAAMVRQLDTLFTSSSEVPDTGTDTSDQSGMIGQDGHGNEPCHNFAYLYSYAGQPWKTQRWGGKSWSRSTTIGPRGFAATTTAARCRHGTSGVRWACFRSIR